ncbi:ATP-dependent DNA helicase RecG [Lederbergia wuyishanensis]|uniref:ATP-dependent DNA helicase RecG n=1 Tax=Lederbergia wuyishanensis TaxID=1347903 RepID=A0ABU0CZM0_9BACI|nr:ATP-dependent DNA helicase RecG [Lederbergia wuyishanensis]MDQ0341597.1 ATP-dependent DNA helicase RecG [Lederbergia wuyishanensis]
MTNSLGLPTTILKGVGEETAENLMSMGINNIGDLLQYLPFRYEDVRLRDLAEVNHDEKITVEGKVHSEPSVMYYGKKKNRITIHLLVDRYLIKVTFFNRAYLKGQLSPQDVVTVTGKWDKHRQTITGQDIKIGSQSQTADYEPVYPVKSPITVKSLRRFIVQAFNEYGDEVEETLPSQILKEYKLPAKKEALRIMHFPHSPDEVKQARRRFVYEEFLYFQLKMQAFRKLEREQSKGEAHHYNLEKVKSFIASLPFQLTKAQKKVVNEICSDLKSPIRMNRLLQGDVGSGKTAVAMISLYACVTAGYQGALMVPTEILAEQHFQSLKESLAQTKVNIELLTSSVKGKKRQDILKSLEQGEIHILIGTHALIQEDVNFQKLGLVITDEQHRFGVEQRRILREKGERPDVLFMTATPIPRTLAITVFGEMDVSIIDEMPSGRKTIETHWAKHNMLDRILDFVEKELSKGRQAYIICPLIEESDKLDVQNAIDVYDMLSNYFYGKFKIGLMHGRLPASEKEEVMRDFSDNKIQLLVSTTVVEVGVNVPNATVMVVYDAERFGLSQLHQLRGRVGRGSEQSYCILLADPKTDVGKERMRIMTETNDGFVLSERDLELRGPGDFFGKKQSGLPEFKVADMVHDYRALETARNDAMKLIEKKEFWSEKDYEHMRKYLQDSGALSGEKLD